MARHAAADGEASHPLVAAALAGRDAEGPGAHRRSPRGAAEEGDLGWPGGPTRQGGGGLGWPGDVDGSAAPAAGTPEAGPRRGWRRLFGAAPAA
ncbi:hypothetical protein [Blastococcus sp. SYSU DS1024]